MPQLTVNLNCLKKIKQVVNLSLFKGKNVIIVAEGVLKDNYCCSLFFFSSGDNIVLAFVLTET